ncbi:hypothetical protein [Saccharopolyspora aridisoli]|nr:hypothetical protein [Saccharopolyspora aridisoli]
MRSPLCVWCGYLVGSSRRACVTPLGGGILREVLIGLQRRALQDESTA